MSDSKTTLPVIKTCPFCGGNAKLESQGCDAAVHCYGDCGARGRSVDLTDTKAQTKEAMDREAIEYWNDRI